MNKVLVIAPHPDDEVLGCGGTISKLVSEGNEVFLCIVTKAHEPDWSLSYINKKQEEIEESGRILGIKEIFPLDFPTVMLDTFPQKEINLALSKLISGINPHTVFIPSKYDLHKDHRVIFESSLVVTRPHESSVKRLLSYETLSETEYGSPIGIFEPNVYVNISNHIGKKMEAMNAYSSEIKPSPHPRSIEGIKALASKRGSESGVEFAEAFHMIRERIF